MSKTSKKKRLKYMYLRHKRVNLLCAIFDMYCKICLCIKPLFEYNSNRSSNAMELAVVI